MRTVSSISKQCTISVPHSITFFLYDVIWLSKASYGSDEFNQTLILVLYIVVPLIYLPFPFFSVEVNKKTVLAGDEFDWKEESNEACRFSGVARDAFITVGNDRLESMETCWHTSPGREVQRFVLLSVGMISNIV